MKLLTAFLVVLASASAAFANDGFVAVEAFPPRVQLDSARDRQRIVVQARHADGRTVDVTAVAEITLSDGKLAAIDKADGRGATLRPLADGEGSIRVNVNGLVKEIPLKVVSAASPAALSFRLDVMPVFARAGCNTGSCHGAARGKDGFRLSLFGFDPEGDHYRLTRELSGRRLDLAVPDKSLLLEKSVGGVPHTGGKRFAPESELHADIVRWIDANCPNDAPTVATCTSIAIYPTQAVLDGPGEKQPVTVVAKYSDGTTRDVTSLALFLSNDDIVASISPEGAVTAGQRGEAYIMARFATHTVGSQYIVLPKGLQ